MANSKYKWMLKKIVSWQQQRFYGAGEENEYEKWYWNDLESHEKQPKKLAKDVLNTARAV